MIPTTNRKNFQTNQNQNNTKEIMRPVSFKKLDA